MINETDSDYAKAVINGASTYCKEADCELIVFSGRSFGWPYGWGYQSTAIYEHIHQNSIDALVISTGTQLNFIGEAGFTAWIKKLAPLPVVSIAIPIENIPTVRIDNKTGLKKLLEHLFFEHDCRNFGLISGPSENIEARQRMAVFNEFLEEHGLKLEDQVIFDGDFSAESVHNSLEPWLENNRIEFQALVCLNDTMATAALQILNGRGIKVPEDVLVTGFDDILRARFDRPSLTTVTQDLELQGNRAAFLAHELFLGNETPKELLLHTRPLYRQSCGCIGNKELANRQVAVDEESECIDFDMSQTLETTENWFSLQDDVMQLRRYLSAMTSLVSLNDLLDLIPHGFSLFKIDTFALVLFDEAIIFERGEVFKLPKSATVLINYDAKTMQEADRSLKKFNPQTNVLPENTLPIRSRALVATSLYHRENQLGYLIGEFGSCDSLIYETLSVQLASTIHSVLLFEAKQEAEKRLSMALRDLERYNTKLSAISRTDEMTGLYNRRGFLALGQETMNLAVRMDKVGLVVFADMDGLKEINDRYGHEAGDRAIIAMGKALKKTFRSMDVVSRLGGDEFAVVAIDLSKSFIKTLRDRLNSLIAEYNRTSKESFTLSLSFGAVEFSGGENSDLESLLSSADAVLYQEKKEKRAARIARASKPPQ